jgi:hypothetical protein
MRIAIAIALIMLAPFGCSNQDSNPKLDLRFRTLSDEVLRSIPDSELEAAVFEHALHRLTDHWDREAEVVRNFSPGLRMLYTTWVLEAEVNNGGFNQYFWNQSGELAPDALASLRLVGAEAHASLLERAIAMHEREASTLRQFKERGTLEAFSESYDHTELNSLDDEFFKLNESLSALRLAYIRAHAAEFTSR